MSRPSPHLRSQFKHFKEIQTRWNDNDIFGHVNNAVYYQWLDLVVNNWMIDTFDHDHKNADWIALVAETGCVYFSEVAYPEMLDLGLRCVKIGRSSVIFEIGVFRKGAEIASANGRFVQVVVDRASKKPVGELPQVLTLNLSKLV